MKRCKIDSDIAIAIFSTVYKLLIQVLSEVNSREQKYVSTNGCRANV